MSVVRYLVASDARRAWRTWFVLVVIAGLAGGVALAAVAGARRTASAYERFLEASDAPELTVEPPPFGDSGEFVSAVEGLPEVASTTLSVAMFAETTTTDGKPLEGRPSQVLASVDGRWFDTDRPKLVRGRLPDPSRADEAMMNELLAEEAGLEPGDRIGLVAASEDDFETIAAGELPEGAVIEPVEITGVVVLTDEVVEDDAGRISLLMLTPAYYEKHSESAGWGKLGLNLHNGWSDVPSALKRLNSMLGDELFYEDLSVAFERTQRAIRPQAVALGVFGAVVAAGLVLLLAQALVRQVQIALTRASALRALGLSPGQVASVAALPPVAVTLVGVVLAVGVAVLLSPLTPVGAVRRVEPSPGVSFDTVVLLGGALVLLLALTTPPSFAAWRGGRRRHAAIASRPSRVADSVARSPLPASVGIGVRMAIDPGRGASSIPVRSTIAGVVVASACAAAALTFGHSLSHLVDRPELYGWNWDVAIQASSGWGDVDREVDETLGTIDEVEGWSRAMYVEATIRGEVAQGIILERTSGDVAPPLVSGRLPAAPDEVALGGGTLSAAAAEIGDRIEIIGGGESFEMTVVGEVVLPAIGRADTARPGLGEGLLFDASLIEAAGMEFGSSAVFVRYDDRADEASVTEELESRFEPMPFLDVMGTQRPGDITNYTVMGRAPGAMALVVGIAAVAAVAHLLITSIRRRRHDMAVLRTVGFVRRQVASAVAWQATTVALVGVLLGIPLGAAAGRSAWMIFAESVGVVPEPVVPLTLGGLAVAMLLLTNIAGALPARLAARVRPASVLRAE